MNKIDVESIAKGLVETFNVAGTESIKLFKEGLKITIKEDNSPVTNGDLKVNSMLTERIKVLTPNIPIISEETVNLKNENKEKIFWLIDPIDGTKEYLAGKDEYTINAALIEEKKPIMGLVGVPRKNRIFYSYGANESYLLENNIIKKNNCVKKSPSGKIIALSSVANPSADIQKKLKEYNVTSVVKMASSYKFCVIANGEYDIYAAKERAMEWDYAAGHAVAEHAGAVITTLDGKPFLYGKSNYKNPSLLMKRSKNLND